jgi:hypothetical protein
VQVGRVTEPGRYIFKFGWLTITAEDLAVWGTISERGAHLLQNAMVTEEAKEDFRLIGTFELRKNISMK